jgi:hypothetical protein
MNNQSADLGKRLLLRELVDSYAIAVDKRDAERFVSLFLPGGVLTVYEPDVPEAVVTFTGSDELRSVTNLLQNFGTTFHLMANHLCQINGDMATGEVYCLANHLLESDSGLVNLCMYIRYYDSYALTADGWRFAQRDVRRQWTEERPADLKPLDLSGVRS